jgi:CopG family transcriptional regulator/antitoxin EndoAI
VTISVPPDLARAVDEQAEAEGRTRSELYREAVRQYLRRRDRWDQIFAYGREVAQRTGVTEDEVVEAVLERRGERRNPAS